MQKIEICIINSIIQIASHLYLPGVCVQLHWGSFSMCIWEWISQEDLVMNYTILLRWGKQPKDNMKIKITKRSGLKKVKSFI